MARFSENHYASLGVSRDASLSEIRRAYHEAALRFHPDTSKEAFATDRFIKIQEAYDVLSSPARRREYNKTLPDTQENAGIQLRVSYSRPSLLRQTTPQLIYVLLEVLVDPTSTVMDSPPLNLCLVIDRSTSMKGSRLDMVKTTARRLIHQLRQEDNLSIVAFSDRAEVILPASRGFDPNVLDSRLSQLQAGGGTEIYTGLAAGLEQIQRNLKPSNINHIVLITDGHTYGDEEKCLTLAEHATDRRISISGLGIGEKWNDEFIDRLTAKTGGNSMYVAFAKDIKRFLEVKFQGLNQIHAENTQLDFEKNNDIELRYLFRLQPEPTKLETTQPIPLGNIPRQKPFELLFELLVNDVSESQDAVSLISGKIKVEIPQRMIPTVSIPIEWRIDIADGLSNEPVPPKIMKAMSKLTLYRMQEQANLELAEGENQAATRRLKHLATHLLAKGEGNLASTVLQQADLIERGDRHQGDLEKQIKFGTRALLLPPGESE